MKRLFTAMPFTSSQFDQWYLGIRMKYPHFEWYLPRDLHITLQFMGNVADDLASTVEDRLKKIQLNTQQIHFTTTRPQAFYKKGKPFVVWMGLNAEPTLTKLYQDISKELRGLYQDRNMEYIPHITLFRCKNNQEQAVAQFLDENPILLDLQGQISHFCLFEANLEDENNRYQVLKCFNL